ncbi:MAG: undecaprenyl-diphosphate phosphatase [Dehalococcoidia bacterium]|nr:undecaprenyl-diphosphate phosphatase [Dehalococcoidia bacterium]
MRREDAARFAFLLGTPAFAGAALLKAFDFGAADDPSLAALAVGIVTSAVVGFVAIHYLLRFLRTRSLVTFVVYRYLLAGLTLALVAGGLI